jgi:hypothetical protein
LGDRPSFLINVDLQKIVLLETTTRKIESEFSSLHFVVDEERRTIIIPPIYEEFGSIESQDEGNELIVIVGNFTHWHVSCYEEDLSDNEKAEMIVEDIAEFLRGVFNDKIIMWGSHKGRGGFIYRDEYQTQEPQLNAHQKWLWSQPLSG